MMEESRKGIEGNRSSFAYRKVIEVVQRKDKKLEKEYKAYVKKIPMLIKTNGLGATFAFIKAKSSSGNAYDTIYKQVSEWIRVDEKKIINLSKKDDLVKIIVELPSPSYRALTTEILSLFNWLRRFAEGLIEGSDKK